MYQRAFVSGRGRNLHFRSITILLTKRKVEKIRTEKCGDQATLSQTFTHVYRIGKQLGNQTNERLYP